MQAACSIQKHQVVSVLFCVFDGGLGDVDRITLPHLKDGDAQLLSHDLQLVDGGGTEGIAGGQERPFAVLLFHEAGQFGAVSGLAGAVEAHHHDHRWGSGGEIELDAVAAHQGCQLFVDNLHDHLGGGQALQHVCTHGPFRDPGNKILYHLKADIGLQKSQPDLPHGLLHVCFR